MASSISVQALIDREPVGQATAPLIVRSTFLDPARFRLDDGNGIGPANQNTIAPFGAVRSDEILPVARARFDVVEERLSGQLFPLHLYLDLAGMGREAPEIVEQLITREREIASDPAATACTAYVVLRKR